MDADEASEHADESAGPRIARRIWGPVTKDVSESIGAPAAVASVQLQPRCIPFELLQEVHALVPVEVLPTAEDTKRSLAVRLAKSDYLHPVFVLNKGNGTGKCKYVQLNRTEYSQPSHSDACRFSFKLSHRNAGYFFEQAACIWVTGLKRLASKG